MIPPDQEIYDVEKRIAERRHRVEAVARQSGRAALKTLTSPWTLAGAAVIGYLVAAAVLGWLTFKLAKELPFTALLRQLRGRDPEPPQ